MLGTHSLLEAAKANRARVSRFIHVSTDEVYGEGSSGEPSHEGTEMDPTNPYSASKAGAEHLVTAYRRSFDLPIIITRGNNVYGPHQFPEKIVPKFIAQIVSCALSAEPVPQPPRAGAARSARGRRPLGFTSRRFAVVTGPPLVASPPLAPHDTLSRDPSATPQSRGRKLTLHGTGTNTRNYLFVEDVARAFDVILHKGEIGGVYNIGGDNERSNLEVAKTLLAAMGVIPDPDVDADATAKHITFVSDRPFNDLRYPLDCKRLAALGWTEEVSFTDGIARTIEWYKTNSGNWGDIESAIVAHPRRGNLTTEVTEGKAPSKAITDDETAVEPASTPTAAAAAAKTT